MKSVIELTGFICFSDIASMKQAGFIFFFFTVVLLSCAQTKLPGQWRASLVRQDSNTVVFLLKSATENNKTVFYLLNATEKIRIDSVSVSKDSVHFSMPVFESSFKTKRNQDGSLQGTWSKGTGAATQHWPFFAYPDQPDRFLLTSGNAKENISGRWDVTITRANGTLRKAMAEFVQKGNKLTGTFLTPSGDYRFLEGVVTGDSIKLSTFDGAHAYTFYAKVENAKTISNGVFYSGINGKEIWKAKKDANIKPPKQNDATQLREGESKLNFTFNDLNDKPVSINDDQYKNKVVIIQIMGSWCPNCMDETKFLSDYYDKNKNRGVEVIALAYEYSTDPERSKKSLRKFQQLFNVQYPMLITGATSGDEMKTEKTLPQLTPIRSFPTTIFIDKKGNVREVHGTFYGPGTGKYHEEFKKEFYRLVDELLKE
jgi:thiol-disulfide isomerase/thioredoxin